MPLELQFAVSGMPLELQLELQLVVSGMPLELQLELQLAVSGMPLEPPLAVSGIQLELPFSVFGIQPELPFPSPGLPFSVFEFQLAPPFPSPELPFSVFEFQHEPTFPSLLPAVIIPYAVIQKFGPARHGAGYALEQRPPSRRPEMEAKQPFLSQNRRLDGNPYRSEDLSVLKE
jgi:hypothetical protein